MIKPHFLSLVQFPELSWAVDWLKIQTAWIQDSSFLITDQPLTPTILSSVTGEHLCTHALTWCPAPWDIAKLHRYQDIYN